MYGEIPLPEAKRRHIQDLVLLAEFYGPKSGVKSATHFAEDTKTGHTRTGDSGDHSARAKLQSALNFVGMDARALAKKIGYSVAVIQAVVDGQGKASEKMIEAIVSVVPGLTKEDLMNGSESTRMIHESGMEGMYGSKPPHIPGLPDDTWYAPLLSWAQAGALNAGHLDDAYDYEGVLVSGIKDRRAFAVQIKGDSMTPAIQEGDRAVVCPSATVRLGDTVIVRTLDGDVWCKVYHPKGTDHVIFVSENSKHPPIEIPRSEIAWMYPVKQVLRNL